MNRLRRIVGLKLLAAAVFTLSASACSSDGTVYRNVGNIPEKPDPYTPDDERPVIQKSLEADRAKNGAAGTALEKEAAEQPPPPEAPPAAIVAAGQAAAAQAAAAKAASDSADSKATKP